MNHTPTPWTIGQYQREIDANGEEVLVTGIYSTAEGVKVAKMEVWTGEEYREESDANAEFVVRACNAHEELVGALHMILDGNTMAGRENWTHADVIQEHYKIARKALTTIEKGA